MVAVSQYTWLAAAVFFVTSFALAQRLDTARAYYVGHFVEQVRP